jgi:hypothetical protein
MRSLTWQKYVVKKVNHARRGLQTMMSRCRAWRTQPSKCLVVSIAYVIQVGGFDPLSLVTLDLQCHKKGLDMPLLGPCIIKPNIKSMSTLYFALNFVHRYVTINVLWTISEYSTLWGTLSSTSCIQMSRLCLKRYMNYTLIRIIRFKLGISFIVCMTSWNSFVLIKSLLIDA